MGATAPMEIRKEKTLTHFHGRYRAHGNLERKTLTNFHGRYRAHGNLERKNLNKFPWALPHPWKFGKKNLNTFPGLGAHPPNGVRTALERGVCKTTFSLNPANVPEHL